MISSNIQDYWENPWLAVEVYKKANTVLQNGEIHSRYLTEMTQTFGRVLVQAEHHAPWNTKRSWKSLDIKAFYPIPPLMGLISIGFPKTYRFIDQETFNFLNFADQPHSAKGVKNYLQDRPVHNNWDDEVSAIANEMGITEEELGLANAFRKQMIEEASPFHHQVVKGSYIMQRTPLAQVDACIEYRALRLHFTGEGFFISFDNGDLVSTPFWWSPVEHTFWMLGFRCATVLDMMCSCIWRDACILKTKLYYERTRGEYKPKRDKHMARKLVLPRHVSEVLWGEEEADRDTGITHRPHLVKGFYRTLPEGWKRSQEAVDKAEAYGYPAPPEGWTFVSPHQRGKGEVDGTVKEVICKGLNVAQLILG